MHSEAKQTTFFFAYPSSSDPFLWKQQPISKFEEEHDLTGLGPWGPYGKRYFGLSFLPDHPGARIDIIVVPELNRRKIFVPHALKESEYLPWDSDSDFQKYSYRQQIIPKDDVFANIEFVRDQANGYTIEVEWHNRTDISREVRLHLCMGPQEPATGSWQPRSLRMASPRLASKSTWVDSLDYEFARIDPSAESGLLSDAKLQGECIVDGFAKGYGLRWPEQTGKSPSVTYRLPQDTPKRVAIRYISEQPATITLTSEDGFEQLISLEASSFPGLSEWTSLPTCCQSITLEKASAGLLLDGLLFSLDEKSCFEDEVPISFADIRVVDRNRYTLSWPQLGSSFELEVPEPASCRKYTGDLDQALLLGMHDHVSKSLLAPGIGRFHDFISPQIVIPGNSKITQKYRIRAVGSQSSDSARPPSVSSPAKTSHEAKRYCFGVDRLAAVLQTNIVYPVRLKGKYIRHFPPGRWWDSLYTWDCGFIALGLAEIAPRRSVELLNTYVTEPGDRECAFTHHGSPVPVQHYLLQDLWNKTQDRDLLGFFYPRLSQHLRYIAGLDDRSPTRPFQNHLLSTWNLFYNSGGWDDYPPQYHLTNHAKNRIRNIAPMVVSSHVAVAADIMAMAATELKKDPSPWINLSQNLVKDMDLYAWDEDEQIYGYVEHDAKGNAVELYRHPASRKNFNMGLDGVMPFITGRIHSERSTQLLARLKDEKRLLTPMGLSTVDRTAPYYKRDGYWNGAVWIPYQYIFWKALLDAGETRFAYDLAHRILATYERETRDAYNCFEHFMIESQRGAGWHHFGGLSAPVLNLFAAYYVQGRISTGFRTWVHELNWDRDQSGLNALLTTLSSTHQQKPSVIITLKPNPNFQVTIDGEPTKHNEVTPGVIEVKLKRSECPQRLIITPKDVYSTSQ